MAYYYSDLKPEVLFPEQTGNIITFNDEYGNLPLKSCKVNIPVTQEGTGDPSPDNVRNFVGIDSLDFSATGKNLWGGKYLLQDFIKMNLGGNFTYDDEKLLFGANQMSGSKVIHTANFKANTRYTIILTGYNNYYGLTTNMSVLYTDNTRTDIAFPNNTPNMKQTVAFVTTANKTVQAITGRNAGANTTLFYNECCLLEGVKTADDFVPFGDNKLFTFGQTIYAGELDVLTGIFTATHKLVDLGSLIWSRYTNSRKTYFRTASEIADCVKSTSVNTTFGLYCSSYIEGAWTKVIDSNGYENQFTLGWANHSYIGIYDPNKTEMTVEDFKQAMTGIYLLYPLATPEVINLGGTSLLTAKGENNFFSSVGQTTLQNISIRS